MKRLTAALTLFLLLGLSGCGESGLSARYDMEGIAYLAFSDIDSVCEEESLTQAGQRLLAAQGDDLLLSYVVDSAILIADELGDYDHLVMVDPQWVERFGSLDRLDPISIDSLDPGMQRFLKEQMPILTTDGSVLPEGAALYEYDGGLLAFPVGVTLGMAEPIEVENPLVILIGDPAQALDPKSCTLPLASSGNILFSDLDRLEAAFHGSGLEDYGEIQILGQTTD